MVLYGSEGVWIIVVYSFELEGRYDILERFGVWMNQFKQFYYRDMINFMDVVNMWEMIRNLLGCDKVVYWQIVWMSDWVMEYLNSYVGEVYVISWDKK